MTSLRHRSGPCALVLVALAALLAQPPLAAAIGRDAVLARGKVWVDRKVPYSQSGWADEGGNVVADASLGWRRDCSGFASYCLGLRYADGRPLSYDSASITKVLEPITKDELRPGDIINRSRTYPGAPYGHAIVFVAWADEAHAWYWSYEESSGSGGAVMRMVPYPFWGDPPPAGFFPYRYLGIEEEYDAWIEPIRGASRYDTAVRASRSAFATGTVGTVVVCSGAGWADALGGASLAGAVGGPILLVRPTSLPAAVASETARLGANRALVVGGESAVASPVVDALLATGIGRVERIGGADRYETAALVASATARELRARGRAPDGTVYVASGVTFPDALAVSPVASRFARPVLLSRPDGLPQPSAAALASLAPTRAVLLGGERALAVRVASACAAPGRAVPRIAGADRYATAAAIAAHGVAEGLSWSGLGVATGQSYPDALAGGVAQGALGAPLVLTPSTWLHPAATSALTANRAEIGRGRCFGGFVAVTSDVRREIAVCLGMTGD